LKSTQQADRLIVSTNAADNLRFYQRRGFRMSGIVRDAFAPSKGYPEGAMGGDIPLRDQVLLDLDLTAFAAKRVARPNSNR